MLCGLTKGSSPGLGNPKFPVFSVTPWKTLGLFTSGAKLTCPSWGWSGFEAMWLPKPQRAEAWLGQGAIPEDGGKREGEKRNWTGMIPYRSAMVAGRSQVTSIPRLWIGTGYLCRSVPALPQLMSSFHSLLAAPTHCFAKWSCYFFMMWAASSTDLAVHPAPHVLWLGMQRTEQAQSTLSKPQGWMCCREAVTGITVSVPPGHSFLKGCRKHISSEIPQTKMESIAIFHLLLM